MPEQTTPNQSNIVLMQNLLITYHTIDLRLGAFAIRFNRTSMDDGPSLLFDDKLHEDKCNPNAIRLNNNILKML